MKQGWVYRRPSTLYFRRRPRRFAAVITAEGIRRSLGASVIVDAATGDTFDIRARQSRGEDSIQLVLNGSSLVIIVHERT